MVNALDGPYSPELRLYIQEHSPELARRLGIAGPIIKGPITVHELGAKVFGSDTPTRSQVESVRQVVKKLAAERIVVLDYRDGQLTAFRSDTPEQICEECEGVFRARQGARYCSNACRQRAYRERQKEIADARAGRRAPIMVNGRLIGREG